MTIITGHSVISHVTQSIHTFISIPIRKIKDDFQMRFLPTLKDTQLTEIMFNFALVITTICILSIISIQATFIAAV